MMRMWCGGAALVLSVYICHAHGSKVRALGVEQQAHDRQVPALAGVHQRRVPVPVDGIHEPRERAFRSRILIE